MSKVMSFAEAAQFVGFVSARSDDPGARLRRLVRNRERDLGKVLTVPIGETGRKRGVTLDTLRRYLPRLFDSPHELRREFLGHMRDVSARLFEIESRIDGLEARWGEAIQAIDVHLRS